MHQRLASEDFTLIIFTCEGKKEHNSSPAKRK